MPHANANETPREYAVTYSTARKAEMQVTHKFTYLLILNVFPGKYKQRRGCVLCFYERPPNSPSVSREG